MSYSCIELQNIECKNCVTKFKKRKTNYSSTDSGVDRMGKSEED
ncbi:MAG: hypothetical protein ACKO7Y_07080 [Candidatus Nitrosotenuis sp.]